MIRHQYCCARHPGVFSERINNLLTPGPIQDREGLIEEHECGGQDQRGEDSDQNSFTLRDFTRVAITQVS